VALLGFSQGGYVGYGAALRLSHRLAAYVGCSTRFKDETFAAELPSVTRRIPILHLHGMADQYLDPGASRASLQALTDHGWDVTWHPYEGTHQLARPQVTAIRDWLATRLDLHR
jgi:predicted esterase